eukprot:TRINITY_DN50770_c0_g1_i1.p1 TRINITY_DN50770_c0_g1~~TRINITY_DN50770_c0_g1_i1.p1  ORF type:complete len:741 (-),score=131.09 TRINITY_DN50770_c0_g1_i1:54-2276(-)
MDLDYIIPTIQVNPETLDKLDCKNSSRDKDDLTVKMPSFNNVCPIQMWEVYFLVAVLLVQPPSSIIVDHVKALCEHNEPTYLCETVLKEHSMGIVSDLSQEISLYTFYEEYILRKFGIAFSKNSLLRYITDIADDVVCGKNSIPRVYLAFPFVQAFMRNTQFFDGQYDELVDSMRTYNLPVFDALAEPKTADVGDSATVDWDAVKLYDDPSIILKKYGGWAMSKGQKLMAPKDQLMMRLTGMSLEQLLMNQDVPVSPRDDSTQGPGKQRSTKMMFAPIDDKASEASSHPSDFEVDPVHVKIMPLGLTVSEAYLLIRGLLMASESNFAACNVLGDDVASTGRDGHLLAAAVLIDLYMRDQMQIHHWTLQEGHVAVPYRVQHKKGLQPMRHYLDHFTKHCDAIFRTMRLSSVIGGEYVIWSSLEEKGIIDNRRSITVANHGCGWRRADLWDLVRADVLLDIKEGYVTAARLLYDKDFPDPHDEVANDILIFCYILQSLFDLSVDAVDGFARVLNNRCPPFHKGELFPPVASVHSGGVCLGIAERAFRFAKNQELHLAQEAADFNEQVMERFEEKFFLSPKIWSSFDTDGSGELTLEEFVEGMRNVDIYKDFRRERVPDAVLRMIVSDLAERLFYEVDVNGDGTLTNDELLNAFKRRRQDAVRARDGRNWFSAFLRSFFDFSDSKRDSEIADLCSAADKSRDNVLVRTRLKAVRRQREWMSELERPSYRDEEVDIHAPLPSCT